MTTLSVQRSSPTNIAASIGSLPSGNIAVQIQYSREPDFQFGLAPLFSIPGSPSTVDTGLFNQEETYFFRARGITSAGAQQWSNVDAVYMTTITPRDLTPAAIMIQPALIVPPEPVLQTFSLGTISGYPAEAMLEDSPASHWAAVGIEQEPGAHLADQYPTIFVLGFRTSGGPVDVLSLLGTNFPDNALIYWSAGETFEEAQSGSPAFITPVMPLRASASLPGRPSYHSFTRLDEVKYHKWWRAIIFASCPGNIGIVTHAVLGKAWETKNFAVDSKNETLIDGGSFSRDRGGNPVKVRGWLGRSVEFEIAQMTEAQYEGDVEHLRWRSGVTRPMLVVPNSKPGAFLHDRILYGQMGATRAVNNSSPRFSQSFQINSVI